MPLTEFMVHQTQNYNYYGVQKGLPEC